MIMKFCGLLIIGLIVHVSSNSTTKDVNMLNGPVTGTSQIVDGKLVWEFLAIPYAEPPIGSLRFRAPKPLSRIWKEPLLSQKAPKGCIQMPSPYLQVEERLMPTYGEDCLYLNVWTPENKSEKKLSVMVWIHGGGFVTGESLPIYNGKALAAVGDVIVVSIHYRLGFMGFARFDSKLVPGNNGLLDQQLALKWVYENIATFGGDPESITIFGQSAGAAAVSYHLINEESGRYFKRGIMQSGVVGANTYSFNPNTDALELLNRKVAAENFKCDQVDAMELLQCMEKVPEEDISALISNFTMKAFQEGEPIGIPTIDGTFLSRNPMDILASGDISRKDVMIGVNEREGSLMVTFMAMMAAAAENITGPTHVQVTPQLVNSSITQYIPHYPYFPQKMTSAAREMLILRSISHTDPSRGEYNAIKLAETLGEHLIVCSVNKFADAIRAVHDNVYFYEMAHMPSQPLLPIVPEDWLKCTHGDDIPFVFALPLVYPEIRNMTDEELLLSRRMVGDWAHFAKTGHPLDHNWRKFTIKEKGFYRYKIKSNFETGGIRRDQCVFWDMLEMVNNLTCTMDDESKCKRSDVGEPTPSDKKQQKDEL